VFATDDTIVAIATPVGRAGLGVVRLSGPAALDVAARLVERRRPLTPRRATLTTIRDLAEDAGADVGRAAPGGCGHSLDRVVVTFFPSPHSYTGEDTVEISAHGSPVILERIVASAMRAGARMAQPGEFTLRAYLHGRIDLVQAEAVGDLIDAVTPAQVRQAFDQLSGTLTEAIRAIGGRLDRLIVRLEASLDFPDEGYHFVGSSEADAELRAASREIRALLEGARRGRVIREGRQVVLLGSPNVGKSSLFNALLGAERAIVTSVPGTTRDLVTERCEIEGSPITLVDTAGLRDGAELVEREGIHRAQGAASVAALAVVVLDRSRPFEDGRQAVEASSRASTRLIVASKADLPGAWTAAEAGLSVLPVSVVSGEGLQELRRAMVAALVGDEDGDVDTPRVSNVRHIGLLETAETAVRRGLEQSLVKAPEELLLADIHEARRALDEVVGRRTPEDVLASIFAEFCVGK
jgi:tRNA modification GTPase